MINKDLSKGYHRLHYKINKWKVKGIFGILNYISENVTLVHLMDTFGNVNHAVSIFGYWMFENNYKKVLPLTLVSLNVICSPFGRIRTLFHV